jgi:chromosome segregation ATPase
MTFEEVERTIQFMLENQSRFDASLQQIREIGRKTDERLDRIAVQHAALEDVVTTLARSHVELVNSHKGLAEAHKRLAEAQTELNDRVDAFITFVEKYISRGNGGKKRPH